MANHFRLPQGQIPPQLFRVHYEEAVTTYDTVNGFLAGYQVSHDPPNQTQFFDLVERHLNWGERIYRSRYISTFSDRTHAVNWAQRLRSNRPEMPGSIKLMTIEPSGTEWIASVRQIVQQYDWDRAEYFEHEYLFYRQIPSDLIVNIQTI
ncbi:hypothetical protein TWF694_002005 [Orbilia ellipsospora]|uniref:DUF7587 domain-containing protein n=1 Tax=Orbilia ellipsospora TaxID=2528407 RepID=A0AAV9X6W1_9PEZI